MTYMKKQTLQSHGNKYCSGEQRYIFEIVSRKKVGVAVIRQAGTREWQLQIIVDEAEH